LERVEGYRMRPLIYIRMQLQFHPDPAHKLSTNLYDIYNC
jgi:hypothetical protein